MEFWRKRGPVDHSVSPFVPPPFFSLLPPPPLTQQPSLLCEIICLQNSIKMVQCSNLASSTTSTFSSLLHLSSLSSLLLLWLSRESVGFQEVALTCYQLQHSGHQLVLIWSTKCRNTTFTCLNIKSNTHVHTRSHVPIDVFMLSFPTQVAALMS